MPGWYTRIGKPTLVKAAHRFARRAGSSRRQIYFRPRRRRKKRAAPATFVRTSSPERARLLESTEAYGERSPQHGRKLTSSVSLLIHAAVIVLLVALPALLPPEVLPQQTPMVTFLAKPLMPPPPPPPPPPAPPLRLRSTPAARELLQPEKLAVPTPVPSVIPTQAPSDVDLGSGIGSPDGVAGGGEGGVPGGVRGGVPGGIVGGLPESPAPAPPPPQDPVRIAPNAQGAIPIVKVEPVYPEMAINERVQGVVILDVIVDREGSPIQVRVVRSNAVFDAAAIEAVKQWRWSPYRVNEQIVPFKVLITLQFTLTTKR